MKNKHEITNINKFKTAKLGSLWCRGKTIARLRRCTRDNIPKLYLLNEYNKAAYFKVDPDKWQPYDNQTS